MRVMSTFCAVLLLVPVAGVSQVSQPDVLPVEAGSRVRIAAPLFGPGKRVGTVASFTRDTLVLRQSAGTAFQPVATSEITALDVSTGIHTRKAKGAILGFVLGAGIAAGVQAATWKETSGFDFGRGGDAALAALPGGLVGGLVGFLIGAQGKENWVPVSLPHR